MSDIQEEQKRLYKRAEENDIDTYKMYRKIQEQAKVYEEYDNFDREDLIDELEDANDSIVWWQNRFKAKSKANDRLMKRINQAIECIEQEIEEDLKFGFSTEDEELEFKIISILKDEEK